MPRDWRIDKDQNFHSAVNGMNLIQSTVPVLLYINVACNLLSEKAGSKDPGLKGVFVTSVSSRFLLEASSGTDSPGASL